VFAVEWEPGVIRFYVDGTLYFTATPKGMPHGTGWVFDHPFFLLLNLAVGGDWPGNPDSSTQFPQQMLVDYVRVYGVPRPASAILQGGQDAWADARPGPAPRLLPAEPGSLLRPLR